MSVNLPGLKRTIGGLGPQNTAKACQYAGETVLVNRLTTSWLAGKAMDGSALKPYSEGYRDQKVKSGRSYIPNLNVEGDFHRSIKSRIVSDYAVVGPSAAGHKGSKNLTNLQLGRYLQAVRDNIFNVGAKDRADCQKAIKAYLGRFV